MTPINQSRASSFGAPHNETEGEAINYTDADRLAFDTLTSSLANRANSTTGSGKTIYNQATVSYTDADLAEFGKLSLATKQSGIGTYTLADAEKTEHKIGMVDPINRERVYSDNDFMLFKKIYAMDDQATLERSSNSSSAKGVLQVTGDRYSSRDIAAFESLMNFRHGKSASLETSSRLPSFLTEELPEQQRTGHPEYSMKIVDSDRERLKQRAGLGQRLHAMKIVFTPHKRMK